ncbi:PE family protein [Rhodococcus sp. WMMA185]|uniref:PE domain-containing protein n=1 Tax=Rhodococcus sp. WMMA185 TaxID=679318 RepID=UPI00087811C3|nr:PE domain-containing protein [Rhodococcus sp. WMMA185]AOW93805.1 PE family protein [Rhodococcus sp. WMMA185]
MPALQVAPEALIAAAAELDALAIRLEASVALNSAAIRVLPSGSDEVSRYAAQYFNTVSGSFSPAVAQAIREMHETANTLRAQAAVYSSEDLALGAALESTM